MAFVGLIQSSKHLSNRTGKIRGVVKADAPFGMPGVIMLVEGDDIATMDTVIDKIAAVPKVQEIDSKVARWIG